MKKRRRKRRRRIRISARGYILLAILVVVLVFVARICVVSYSRKKRADAGNAPAVHGAASTVAPLSASEPPPTQEAPAVTPPPAPTAAAELASTGARLPTKEEEAGAVEGVVRTSNVAMRKGASTTFDIVHKYDVGERVLVYAQENEYSLVKVLSDERYGFVATEFITKFGLLPGEAANCTPVPAVPADAVMGVVNVEELKLRSVPSTDGNTPLGMCKKGEMVFVRFLTGEFYYVEVAATGQRGYVFAEYVMVRSDVPTGSPVPTA